MKSQKEETPEKPDFEALVEGGSYLDWPESNAYKQGFVAGCERIWRDYVVASKEVEGWIDVKEKLPKNNEKVLCYRPELGGRWKSDSYSMYSDQDDKWFERTYTHWRPLPEPPMQTLG